MWAFWVYPGQSSLAQCVTCHWAMRFMAPGNTPQGHYEKPDPGDPNYTRFIPPSESTTWPDIHEVKTAFTLTRTNA